MDRIGKVALTAREDVREVDNHRHLQELRRLKRDVEEDYPPSRAHVARANPGDKG